ncbi:MAG: PilZ domain-containing protein [Desulfobacterales bacterium]
MDKVDYLLNLPEQISVGFNFTTISGQQLKKNGTLFINDPPTLELKVLPGTFTQSDPIDLNSDCLIFIETADIATLVCTITGVEADNVIHIRARELIQHSDKRKYFRGPAGRLSIFCCQKDKDNADELDIFQAAGVNISCGGILITLDRPVAKNEILALDIQTPEPCKKIISCHGTVVRVKKFQSSYFVGIKFTDLDSNMCDDIMAFCFAEQRRMLRELVIPKDL